MPGNGECLPVEATHFDLAAGADQRVVLKTGGLLAEWGKQQGVFIPFGNRRMQPGRDDDLAAKAGL